MGVQSARRRGARREGMEEHPLVRRAGKLVTGQAGGGRAGGAVEWCPRRNPQSRRRSWTVMRRREMIKRRMMRETSQRWIQVTWISLLAHLSLNPTFHHQLLDPHHLQQLHISLLKLIPV